MSNGDIKKVSVYENGGHYRFETWIYTGMDTDDMEPKIIHYGYDDDWYVIPVYRLSIFCNMPIKKAINVLHLILYYERPLTLSEW
jgi:hypothetical protein